MKFFSVFSNFIKDAASTVTKGVKSVLRGRKPSNVKISEPYIQKPPKPKIQSGAAIPTPTPIPRFKNAEEEAMKAARRMISIGRKKDATPAEIRAKNKAINYLNRRSRLAAGGKLQDRNREELAKGYLRSGYASPEELEERVQRSLDTFNANFGFSFTKDTYDTMGKLMASPEFQKLKELYAAKYELIITMVGDAVEVGMKFESISNALKMYEYAGIEPDYREFINLANLSKGAQEDILSTLEDFSKNSMVFNSADDIEREQIVHGVFGDYINYDNDWYNFQRITR